MTFEVSEVIIREAVREDCPKILTLIHELAAYEKKLDEATVTLSEMENCGFGENPIWWAFVADHSTLGIIGIALYYIRYSTWKGPMLYLEDFVVTSHLRGHGVGKQLFDRVYKRSAELKCHGMVWSVLNWNEPALNFYRKVKAEIDSSCLIASLPEISLLDS